VVVAAVELGSMRESVDGSFGWYLLRTAALFDMMRVLFWIILRAFSSDVHALWLLTTSLLMPV
jgi:hypothetical protein